MIIQIRDYPTYKIRIEPQPDNDVSYTQSPDRRELVSLDLHVGELIKLPGNDSSFIPPKRIVLRPNDCVRIQTRERLTVPDTVFGQICSRASLTAEGLVAANLKIDPKFQGNLVVAVYNTSKNRIVLDSSLPFCSIFFQTLEHALPEDAPVRVPPPSKIIIGSRFKDWLFSVAPFLLTFLASVAASLIASIIFRLLRH